MFQDFIVVSSSDLGPAQYYQVNYQLNGNEAVFVEQEDWQIVELTFEPAQLPAVEEPEEEPEESLENEGVEEEMPNQVTESVPDRYIGQGRKIRERASDAVRIEEAQEDEPRIIRAEVATADVVNGNGRRYREAVLVEAVADAQLYLQESLSQGRAILLGEAEHPKDKRQKPQFLETIVKWIGVEYDEAEKKVLVAGEMIENSRGRDAIVTMDAGVLPGISLRGRGETNIIREGKRRIEEVEWIRFTGFDLVLNPSFEDAAVIVLETEDEQLTEEVMETEIEVEATLEEVDDSELREEIRQNLLQEQQEAAAQAERDRISAVETELRESLGLEEGDDIAAAIAQRDARLLEMEEAAQRQAVDRFIGEQMASVEYPDNLREQLVSLVGQPKTVEEARSAFESARGTLDAFLADMRLEAKGREPSTGVEVLGDVIENETGVPSFGKPAVEIAEALSREAGHMGRHIAKPRNLNERFTAEYLRRFDAVYAHHLIREAQDWAEAQVTTPLNLPYSVTRAVIEEAFPELVAASVFDVAPIDGSPIRLWYEVAFEAEAGALSSVTDESFTSAHDAWVELAGEHLDWGSVVITSDPAGTTYVEGTDYVIDYIGGRIKVLSGGSMADATGFLADYAGKNYRQGEGAGIERTRTTLSFQTLDTAADRLGTQITSEAIVFSRSQLGYDVVNGNIAAMVKDLNRTIDANLFSNALSEVLAMANNSGGTWDSGSDALTDLEQYIGVAKAKIANRYYQPTGIVMSLTNADRLSNIDRFSVASSRPDTALDPAGYVGRIKGLPVFTSTEFPDAYILVCNRQLVMHRIFQPLQLKGPFPVIDSSQRQVPAEEWYVEEFNGTAVPVPGKGATVKII
jgi:hypothetical protein